MPLSLIKRSQNGWRTGLTRAGLPEDALQLIEDTSRETTKELMRLNRYVDVLIPRGGAGLIRSVVENSTVPVIETGTGNCHIFVDETADFNMALDIIYNAKTQRIGVCNACESLIVHRKITDQFLPLLKKRLAEKEVEVRADEAARSGCTGIYSWQQKKTGYRISGLYLIFKDCRLCRRGP